MNHFIDTLTETELEDMERNAYAKGDTLTAELLGRIVELQKQVETLEETIEDTVTLEDWEKRNGSAEAYKSFFFECFENLNAHYPAPSATVEHDRGVIFEAIRKGEEVQS